MNQPLTKEQLEELARSCRYYPKFKTDTHKECTSCREVKALDEFGVDVDKPDGRYAKCRSCVRKKDRRDYNHQYWMRRKQDPSVSGRVYKKIAQGRDEHPEKELARRKLRHAVKRGKVKKPVHCSVCKKQKPLQGHHEDYSKPLEVIWMCVSCHKIHHYEN